MNNTELIIVNEKKEYHDCEMLFCFYYDNANSDFKVERDQKYKIFTTLKEVEILNEALRIYQANGFKQTYLKYTSEVDGSKKYSEFENSYNKALGIAKELQSLANDEDSLVQLSEYCLEVAPTYVDDFGINKQIEAIIVDSKQKEISGYEDLKEYLMLLK